MNKSYQLVGLHIMLNIVVQGSCIALRSLTMFWVNLFNSVSHIHNTCFFNLKINILMQCCKTPVFH